jgi:hypothetical protein
MCAAYGKRSPNYSFDHTYERMADFKNLPIHSVEVKLLYNGRPMPKR